MRKRIALLLAAVLALSLVACGNGEDSTPEETAMTKEQMLEQAQELNLADLRTEFRENQVRAEDTYIGNIFTFTDFIREIGTDCIAMSNVYVYLPKEEIMELNRYDMITIVGRIDNLNGSPAFDVDKLNNEKIYEIKDAHYVTNELNLVGTIKIQDIVPYKTYDNFWYCSISTLNDISYRLTDFVNDDVLNTIYNDRNVIISDMIINSGDEVKITGTAVADGIKNGFINEKTGTFSADNVQIKSMTSFELVE